MATAAAPAPDQPAPKKKKKNGKKRLLLLLLVLILVGGAAGAAVYLLNPALIGGGKPQAAPGKPQPHLLLKGSKSKAAEGGEGGTASEGPKYDSSYFQLEKEFTSNLKDSVHLIQVGLAVSTPYDEKVIDHLKAHELAVRSAVLMTLSETDENQIFSSAGKKDLQRRLVNAINDVLKEKEGFGGVANVYFTNFIVQ